MSTDMPEPGLVSEAPARIKPTGSRFQGAPKQRPHVYYVAIPRHYRDPNTGKHFTRCQYIRSTEGFQVGDIKAGRLPHVLTPRLKRVLKDKYCPPIVRKKLEAIITRG